MAMQKYTLKFKQWFLKKVKEVIDTIGLFLSIIIGSLAVWGIFIEEESVILGNYILKYAMIQQNY